ncbi:MAG: hypothetical protein US70_C0015G0018 [Parcubacteria group bacterium GW2011_GWD2_38_11]|nr:MAG: hypothetical protein US70_C0015G0018 [Parcubacteria group bacterium GW2011_GWD2_38_11]
MNKKFSRIVLGTDIEKLSSSLNLTGFLVEFWVEPIEGKPEDFKLDPSCLYVFAFISCEPEILRFMAAKSGMPNFLAFYPRPGNNFLSCKNELGNITLLSQESICKAAREKTLQALEIL